MPVNPVELPVAPTIAASDCEFECCDAPINMTIILIRVNGNFVAAPIIGTLTLDLTGDVPTAFCTNPYADAPVEWLNVQVTEELLFFEIPFTLSDGSVQYVTSSIGYDAATNTYLVYTGNTDDGNYYEFMCTLICE